MPVSTSNSTKLVKNRSLFEIPEDPEWMWEAHFYALNDQPKDEWNPNSWFLFPFAVLAWLGKKLKA